MNEATSISFLDFSIDSADRLSVPDRIAKYNEIEQRALRYTLWGNALIMLLGIFWEWR